MDIGKYTFEEFKEMAAGFHGYPAPGLLIGAYMVEEAKKRLPDGVLFEALCESAKCLPDAVQLLTLCSTGNNWMKVQHLGRYAVSLYDKYTGEGYRVYVDTDKIKQWPEIHSWFFKIKPKAKQDTEKLFSQIEQAGPSICSVQKVTMSEKLLGHAHMGGIDVCPICSEAYPGKDGAICRGCQGDAPYTVSGTDPSDRPEEAPPLTTIPVDQVEGHEALHDMTQIIPGESKGPAFKAGQSLSIGDVCRLQQMGRQRIHVRNGQPGEGWIHENEAIEAFARLMAGDQIAYDLPAGEGKIDFTAKISGLLTVDIDKLEQFNLNPDVMCATRHSEVLVGKGRKVAGSRAIPLYIKRDRFNRALRTLGDGPLFNVVPLKKARVGILVTGTEVFQGLIEDKFQPIITNKVEQLGCTVTAAAITPDDHDQIKEAVGQMIDKGIDLLITTAGMSVDPDDITREALMSAGLEDALFGIPVLPGTMSLVGRIDKVRVIGVPACALFYKTTGFDLLLPRVLADRQITRKDLARLGNGGYCLGCKSCTYPTCPFGK